MPLIRYSEEDVGRELARAAYNGTSHTPERRGDHTIQEYLDHMQAVEQELSQWVTDENRNDLTADLEAYQSKYAQLLRAYLSSHGNVVSAFIAGPANFPTRQMEKRSDWADKHRDRWLEFSRKRLEQLRRKWDPRRRANAPISSDDENAVERLQAKIVEAEHLQTAMKAANKIVRSKLPDGQKVAQMVQLGLSETSARQALVPDYMERVGFPDYALKNNGANIRRMKQRVEQLERAAQDTTVEAAVGQVRVLDNVGENRVQVFFPDKPSAEIRATLKSRGFRWAPSIEAWQRQRTPYALQLAKEIAATYR